MEPEVPVIVSNNRVVRVITFLLISLVILAGVLVLANKHGQLTSRTVPSPTGTVPATNPNILMKLVSSTGSSQFTQTDQVSLTLTASSSGKNIVGYDTLISYDPDYFDIDFVQSADTRFEVSPFKKAGMISITGTKSPSITGATVFDNSKLVNLIFKPKKKGTTTVTIQSAAGFEKTKMIDASTTILTPQLTSITLAIY